MLSVYERQKEIRLRLADAIGSLGKIKVLDELCTCGCYRSQHIDTVEIGHGFCLQCKCIQFTWKGFLVLEGPALGALPKDEDIVIPAEEAKAIEMPAKMR